MAGFDDQKFEAESKYQTYLLGQLRRQGWWHYYLVALAVKVPLGTWLLLIGSVVGFALWRDGGGRLWVWGAFAATPVLAMTLLTDINLGLRYVLPALPFVFLLAGGCLAASRLRWWKLLAVPLLAWNLAALARVHPHELSYFNELAGGPANGRQWLIDSNLDWGQDLRGLTRWLEMNPDWRSAKLAYWGTVPPIFEGIDDRGPPPRFPQRQRQDEWWTMPLLPGESRADLLTFGPRPGKYIVSVNFERGHDFHAPTPPPWIEPMQAAFPDALERGTHGLLYRVNDHGFAYFKHFTPRIEPSLGYSILLYDVDLADANRVRRQLGLPPLPESQ